MTVVALVALVEEIEEKRGPKVKVDKEKERDRSGKKISKVWSGREGNR